jgi:hypothetical protein
VQIWPALALAARVRQVLTYDLVGNAIGVPRQAVGQLLGPIQKYCMERYLPPLSALVVSEIDGMPGDGYIAAQDIPRAQAEVFAFDWLALRAPSPEEFERLYTDIVEQPV